MIFSLKGTQLRAPDKNTQLFYMLMFRHNDRWSSFLIPRSTLHDVRKKFEMNRPKESVKDLTLEIQVDLRDNTGKGWSSYLSTYFDNWNDWPTVPRGAATSEELTA